jgi:hypothetical protein
MRALRVLFAAVVAALSIVVVGAGPSFACSCVSGDADDFAGRATDVVSGTVTDVVPLSSRAATGYVVAVDRVFKGGAGPSITVLSESSGASCGLEHVEPGRRYVVFASHQSMQGKDPDHLWANLCGGTGPATPELVAAVEEATGAGTEPASDETAGTAYESDLTITMDDAQPADDDVLADWALPIGLAAGASLLLLTGTLWVRHALS